MIRLLVGDVFGRIIAELEADIGPISWRLNDVGRMTFALAKTAPKLTEDNLRFGNLVLAQFDNGLPDWGGVIDPPRDWEHESVAVTAYSGEYLLGLRQTDKGRYFSGSTTGTIFKAVISEAAAAHPFNVSLGTIWTGGGGHSPDYHFKDLLDIAQDSLTSRLSDYDFDLTPTVNNGAISFLANFYERKGSDKPGVALIERHNLTEIKLNEQGTIVNSWDLAGEGSDWGDDRITSHAEDASSIATYGLRQGSQIYGDVSVEGTLDAHADNLLAESKDPHNMLELTAANKEPALFADYGIGDAVNVQLYSYGFGGFDAMVRVWDREYDPRSETCKLVVREVV